LAAAVDAYVEEPVLILLMLKIESIQWLRLQKYERAGLPDLDPMYL